MCVLIKFCYVTGDIIYGDQVTTENMVEIKGDPTININQPAASNDDSGKINKFLGLANLLYGIMVIFFPTAVFNV